MSSEERQRRIREQGSRPGEAKRQDEAETSREARERSEGQRADTEGGSSEEVAPLLEDDQDRPIPRR
jgi:hypothetical protein